jgi:hypothetical protein
VWAGGGGGGGGGARGARGVGVCVCVCARALLTPLVALLLSHSTYETSMLTQVMLVAPSIAGLVLAATSDDLTPLFLIELVTCVVGSLVLLAVQLPADDEASSPGQALADGSATSSTLSSSSLSPPSTAAVAAIPHVGGLRSITADIIEPFEFLLTHPPLMAIMAFTGACNLANGMVRVLFTPLIMAFSTSTALAAVLTLSGTGAIVGSVVLGSFAPNRPVRAMLLCSAAQGVLLFMVGTYPSSVLILAVAFLYMSFIPAVRVCRQSIFQRETPVGLQGRIFAQQVRTHSARILHCAQTSCKKMCALMLSPTLGLFAHSSPSCFAMRSSHPTVFERV